MQSVKATGVELKAKDLSQMSFILGGRTYLERYDVNVKRIGVVDDHKPEHILDRQRCHLPGQVTKTIASEIYSCEKERRKRDPGDLHL